MATLQCSRCGGARYDTSHRCEKGCGVMTASNEVESLWERLEQVEAERDALRYVASEARAMGFLTPSAESGADHRALCEFARDLPTSLARRDAELLSRPFEGLPGCTDGDCVVKKPNGMHTNGGCQCIKHQTASTIVQRLAHLRDQRRREAEGGGDE
ncbi:MAG: hypothetical protein CME82_06170 [Halomonas sp.]|nr:hypothetical protein [Halomonas sp.]